LRIYHADALRHVFHRRLQQLAAEAQLLRGLVEQFGDLVDFDPLRLSACVSTTRADEAPIEAASTRSNIAAGRGRRAPSASAAAPGLCHVFLQRLRARRPRR
jgi:pyrroloquinoline quinone (PQQ) biosynthesis protein C